MPSAPTIAFDWQPSQGWRFARWAGLLVGAMCLAWAGIDVLAKSGLAVLAGWLEWRNLRFERDWRRSGWKLDGDGAWSWRRANGAAGTASLVQATLLGPLLVLNLRAAEGRIDLPIWPDALDDATRRRLRVRLANLSAEPAPPGT